MSEYGTIVTEIRRMKERGNMKLTELKCTACNGSLKLDETLKPGEYRPLTKKELEDVADENA